jgi:hypothetical protein
MWARQCISCGVIDARETLLAEDEAQAARGRWTCPECGSGEFEAIVMPVDEPPVELSDEYE